MYENRDEINVKRYVVLQFKDFFNTITNINLQFIHLQFKGIRQKCLRIRLSHGY